MSAVTLLREVGDRVFIPALRVYGTVKALDPVQGCSVAYDKTDMGNGWWPHSRVVFVDWSPR